MKATVRLASRMGTPTVIVTPQPETDEERAQVAAIAEHIPLTFTLKFTSVACLAEDALAIVNQQVRLKWPE